MISFPAKKDPLTSSLLEVVLLEPAFVLSYSRDNWLWQLTMERKAVVAKRLSQKKLLPFWWAQLLDLGGIVLWVGWLWGGLMNKKVAGDVLVTRAKYVSIGTQFLFLSDALSHRRPFSGALEVQVSGKTGKWKMNIFFLSKQCTELLWLRTMCNAVLHTKLFKLFQKNVDGNQISQYCWKAEKMNDCEADGVPALSPHRPTLGGYELLWRWLHFTVF